jgi:general secretion pathway protein K
LYRRSPMGSNRPGHDQAGVALVLALMAISFLVALTLQLTATISRQVDLSTLQRDRVRGEGMIMAGFNLARAALLADQRENGFDTHQDSWAVFDSDKIKELSRDIDLNILISDLGGRLQVNALTGGEGGGGGGDQGQDRQRAAEKYRALWLRFLTSGRFAVENEDEAIALIDAMVDWIDRDDNERPQGAEKGYYQSLQPPSSCHNDIMAYPEELLLVKGMTPLLLFGDGKREGIFPYITTAGADGKININTAPLPVLMALSPRLTEEMAQELIDYREDKDNRDLLATVDWYKRVGGIPADLDFDRDLLTVKSGRFQVTVVAGLPDHTRKATGILLRNENHEQALLSWKVE